MFLVLLAICSGEYSNSGVNLIPIARHMIAHTFDWDKDSCDDCSHNAEDYILTPAAEGNWEVFADLRGDINLWPKNIKDEFRGSTALLWESKDLNMCALSIEGSDNLEDWVANIAMVPVCMPRDNCWGNGLSTKCSMKACSLFTDVDPWVHAGFLTRFRILSDPSNFKQRDDFNKWQFRCTGKEMLITGESLGGATATIAALSFLRGANNAWKKDSSLIHTITLGSPRIFTSPSFSCDGINLTRFVACFGSKISFGNGWSDQSKCDTVPKVPGIFYHCTGAYILQEGEHSTKPVFTNDNNFPRLMGLGLNIFSSDGWSNYHTKYRTLISNYDGQGSLAGVKSKPANYISKCTCRNGTPSKKNCLIPGTPVCKSCNSGYILGLLKLKCHKEKSCYCEGGHASRIQICKRHGGHICRSCYSGYVLVFGRCPKNVFSGWGRRRRGFVLSAEKHL